MQLWKLSPRICILKVWEQDSWWCKFQSKYKGRRWMAWSEVEVSFVQSSVYSDFQWIGWSSPTLRWAICFTQSTASNVNFIQKHPHRHTQHHVYQNVCGLVKVAHKVTPRLDTTEGHVKWEPNRVFWINEPVTGDSFQDNFCDVKGIRGWLLWHEDWRKVLFSFCSLENWDLGGLPKIT